MATKKQVGVTTDFVSCQEMVQEIQGFECQIRDGLVDGLPPFLSKLFLDSVVGVEIRYLAMREIKNLIQLGIRDGLTGLYNRRFFEEQLKIALANAARHQQPVCVIFADIDYFKIKVNDLYGHPNGDIVLQGVARALNSCLSRGSDIVARTGGEEFGFILPYSSLEKGMVMAERIRQTVAQAQFSLLNGGGKISVTVSLGLKNFTPEKYGDHLTPKEMISHADLALYHAKLIRNTVVPYQGGMEMPKPSEQ